LFFASAIAIKNKSTIKIKNVWFLDDVSHCIIFLCEIWIAIDVHEDQKIISIDWSNSILQNSINAHTYKKFRYSILVLWLFAWHFDSFTLPEKTWGCNLWERKNDIHFDFFHSIFEIENCEWKYLHFKRIPGKQKTKIHFKSHTKSSSFTENALLYIAINYAEYESISIENLYIERPDIQEILKFLSATGLDIEYINWTELTVHYKTLSKWDDLEFSLMSDFDQVLFYIMLAVLSKSDIKLTSYTNPYPYKELDYLNYALWKIVIKKENNLLIRWTEVLENEGVLEMYANHYPHIMSDSQPILSALVFVSKSIQIIDDRFIWRYTYWQYYEAAGYETSYHKNSIHIVNQKSTKAQKILKFELKSIRESWLLLLIASYTWSKLKITNSQVLRRWYEAIFDNLSTMWVKNEED
jgi:UDP-N-acetylglucosamine enolpyruvyl transferase